MSNRLANETSPYLLQHKDNPVDWFAWGDEAFETARSADKPILLSVGYSACHWCHVMEHESFEDEAIAALMNEHFVNIKVDREERPDVDSIYMQAVQSLTGRGGWPMTVFLTPDGRPFYGGTYFPPEDRQGMPGFPRLLTAVAEAYKNKRAELLASANQVTAALESHTNLRPGNTLLTTEILDQAYSAIRSEHDSEFGGFGRAPKFPQPMTLDYLMRHHARTRDPEAIEMLQRTLDGMAHGGMYDQVGGGFHRYSTDQAWLVPHFEKMLYDNALLARVYLDAFKVTGMLRYRRIVEETLQYVLREMTHEDGGFYSTQDADSEGEEGKFFLWTPAELAEVLGDEAKPVGAFFDVTEEGNFEGSNILNMPIEPERFAEMASVSTEVLSALVGRAKLKLYEAREQRVHPARDEKVITAWNGLMLRAFAEAGFALDEHYTQAAVRNADFLLRELRPNGRLLRTWKDGVAKGNGYLEDYACLADGLIATYQATFAPRFLRAAVELADDMIELFWDNLAEGFYDTGKDHETLISRPRDFFDNATPSGTSVAIDVLLHLAALTGNTDYERRAGLCLRAVAPMLTRAATGFGRVLSALDYHISRSQELAIVWPGEASPPDALLDVLRDAYLPHLTLVGAQEGRDADLTPLLAERPTQDGQPTAYVCEHFVCQLPTTDPSALKSQLGIT